MPSIYTEGYKIVSVYFRSRYEVVIARQWNLADDKNIPNGMLCTQYLPGCTKTPRINAMLFDSKAHGSFGDAEAAGGFGAVSAADFKGFDDQLTFIVFEQLAQTAFDLGSAGLGGL